MKLVSPAPYGWPNLHFGATGPRPYSRSRPHQGRDWGWYNSDVTRSRRVVAPVGGVVERVYSDGSFNLGWGNRVLIRVNLRVVATLNHLLTGSIQVRDGARVEAGQYIGQMGATGEAYGQVHLHEELYIDGVRVDPDYYRAHDLPGTGSTASIDDRPFSPPPEAEPVVPKRKRNPMDFIVYVGKGDHLKRQYKLEGGKFRLLTPTERNAVDLAATAVGETVHVIEITNTAIAKQGITK